MALTAYQQELQQLLGDQNAQRFNIADLTQFINRARLKIASATQCLRILPPSTGSFATLTVSAGGSGYTAPVVTISAPDGTGVQGVQALATATQAGGVVNGFTLLIVGSGYVSPVVTITDPTGSGTGATASYTLTPFVAAQPGQEVYTFASVNAIIQANNPGIQGIVAVQDIALSWGSWKPMLRNIGAWSQFQAWCRAWNVGQENYPVAWSQFGQGAAGSIYLFPIPSVIAQMDWDCYCYPINLVTDDDAEAIPYPFTDAVPYYAAYWAYMSVQNQDMAEVMWSNYKRQMAEARSFATPSIVSDYYPSDL